MAFKRKVVHPEPPKRSTRTPLAIPRKKLTRDPGAKPRKLHATH